MSEKVTLTRMDLALIAAVLVVGALATGLLLSFLTNAPLPFVMLITCISPAALILLLCIGYLIRTGSENRSYMIPLKVIALGSICMGLLILLDFTLTTRTVKTNVMAKFPRGNQNVIQAGNYQKSVGRKFYDELVDGTAVDLEVTPLFNRIAAITIANRVTSGYTRSIWEVVLMCAGGVLFLVPAGLFRFKRLGENLSRDMVGYLFVIAPAYIISLIACGFWVKMLLVHVFHTVEKM